MPIPYLLGHTLFSALLWAASYRLFRPAAPADPTVSRARLFHQRVRQFILLFLVAVYVLDGAAGEWRPEASLAVAWLRRGDAIWLAPRYLEGVAAALGFLWSHVRKKDSRSFRLRAAILSGVALSAGLASFAWSYLPEPPGSLFGINRWGICRQTSRDSCSAAAAATLLHTAGIRSSEAEMIRLCLTKEHYGTPTLGLYRGLRLRSAADGLEPRFHQLGSHTGLTALQELQRLGRPAILFIGLEWRAPESVVRRLEFSGWRRGVRHSVVALRCDLRRERLLVGDPGVGLEWWPAADLRWIWDGRALTLEPER